MSKEKCSSKCAVTHDKTCCYDCGLKLKCKNQCDSFKNNQPVFDCLYYLINVTPRIPITCTGGGNAFFERGYSPRKPPSLFRKFINWLHENVIWRFYRYPPDY